MKNFRLYGVAFFVGYFYPIYFSQYGEIIGRRQYQKLSIFPIKNFYFYGLIKNNDYF